MDRLGFNSVENALSGHNDTKGLAHPKTPNHITLGYQSSFGGGESPHFAAFLPTHSFLGKLYTLKMILTTEFARKQRCCSTSLSLVECLSKTPYWREGRRQSYPDCIDLPRKKWAHFLIQ